MKSLQSIVFHLCYWFKLTAGYSWLHSSFHVAKDPFKCQSKLGESPQLLPHVGIKAFKMFTKISSEWQASILDFTWFQST